MIQLHNGDCLPIMREMETESIDIVITSPPYWNQKEYSYWPTYLDYLTSANLWIEQIGRLLKPGRHCFWVIPDKIAIPPKQSPTGGRLCMPIYSDSERLAAAHGLIPEFPIIWKKPHGTQKMFGSYPYPPTIIPTPMTERICIWRKPGTPDLSKRSDESRFTKDEWVAYAQDLWELQPDSQTPHPAPFPIDIPLRLLTLFSFQHDTCLDPFLGSGTTAHACIQTNRSCIGIEQDPSYLAYTQSRIATATLLSRYSQPPLLPTPRPKQPKLW